MMYIKELDPSQDQAMGMLIGVAVKLMWKEKWNGLGWLAWTKKKKRLWDALTTEVTILL